MAYYRRHEDNMNANREWTRDGMFRYFESQLQAISHYSQFPLFEERREWILGQLEEEAKCRNPFYLVQMSFRYNEFKYIKVYIRFKWNVMKYSIKKTSFFKFCRSSWLWRKMKGEIR